MKTAKSLACSIVCPARNRSVLACGILVPIAVGCSGLERGAPAVGEKPVEARFGYANQRYVGNAYLILPIETATGKQDSKFLVGSLLYSPSSWSGFSSGSGYSSGTLNLEVVNLANGEHARVFDRQVAVGDWEMSFIRPSLQRADGNDDIARLHFDSLLVIPARTEDTNHDRRLTQDDPIHVYLFDLATRQLNRISPEGHGVISTRIVGQKLILTTEAW